jgi:8-oxo-dGTP diphosphatase
MKRIGVAAIVTSHGQHYGELLLGRRGKDPNRGCFVLPGGGIEDGESCEAALAREIYEETGLRIRTEPHRWERPHLIELSDRIILVARAVVAEGSDTPRDGGDLYDVRWFEPLEISANGIAELSPVVQPLLASEGFVPWSTDPQ